jgi:glutamyl-tRNA(Gln) amidotransferase subunit E
MDEEPPHNLNREAMDVCLTVALMLDSSTIDEVHVMRKTVIDGSNTTGFQRTCIIAVGGALEVGGKSIPIQTICLEEDAARKLEEDSSTTNYRLDRLCVPLVEIATAPVIYSPEEAEKVALALGRVLRATKKVKRGLGSIRQDLNISIKGGALVEVKGVQQLNLVSKVIEYEVQRQLALLQVIDELTKRGIDRAFPITTLNVTHIFSETNCKILKQSLQKGGLVLAVKLPKFAGLLGKELAPSVRFGTELADYAKFWGRVKGIFHTDEMPAFGITNEEVKLLREATYAEKDDAVVIVAGQEKNATDALNAVIERARNALEMIPTETRGANPDGSTHYSRPRPGAARMYPETDITPVLITKSHIIDLKKNTPDLPQNRIARLIEDHNLNNKLANQLMDSEYVDLFELITTRVSFSPSFIAASLTETIKSLQREGVPIEVLSDDTILKIFELIENGEMAKEGFSEIASWLSNNPNSSLKEAIDSLGLKMLSEQEIDVLLEKVISDNEDFIIERGQSSLGFLMGVVMKSTRGRVDASVVSKNLVNKIHKKIKEHSQS